MLGFCYLIYWLCTEYYHGLHGDLAGLYVGVMYGLYHGLHGDHAGLYVGVMYGLYH